MSHELSITRLNSGNFNCLEEFSEILSISSQPRPNNNHDDQETPISSLGTSKSSRSSEGNTEEGSLLESPALDPMRCWWLTTPAKHGAQQEGRSAINTVSPKKIQSFRPKESKWDYYKQCTNYLRYGYCRFGIKCKYDHHDVDQFSNIPESSNEEDDFELSNNDRTKVTEKKTKKRGPCWFFKRTGSCLAGDSCEFTHIMKELQIDKKKSSESWCVANLSDENLKNLRNDEILWIKKRFQERLINECGNTFQVKFCPSDPDSFYPDHAKDIDLIIEIPDYYPKEVCFIQCLNQDDTHSVILIRYINKKMKEWLSSKHEASKDLEKVEPLLQPFFNWLDNSLNAVYLEGLEKVNEDFELEASGIQFGFENIVKHEKLKPVKSSGTEIKLPNLELTDHAGTLSCYKLAFTILCVRCRFRSDIITPPRRVNQIICSRCRHNQRATFKPQLLHQFLPVLGYLDLEECLVIDISLSKCSFVVECSNCNRREDTEGLQFRERRIIWCFYCDSKMGIRVESVKFQYPQPTVTTGSTPFVKLGKAAKKVHPVVQEGNPLPENGTCKHWKKSFIWLRFPCCGKAYPCDFCHDEKETDHEIKRANRMICGYCAKEQPYTNGKYCVSCLRSVTKRTGTHWEGGKGCRDQK